MSAFLSTWWNAPFLVAFLVALGFMAFTLLGSAKDGIGKDLDHDLDLGHDAGLHPEALTASKAPLSIRVTAALLGFALTGLIANAVLWDSAAAASPLAFPLVFVGAVFVGGAAARLAGRALERLLPGGARQVGEHVGRVGVTMTPVAGDLGQVRIDRDARGPMAFIVAVAAQDIGAGKEVLVVEYDPARRLYRVVPTGELA